MTWRIDGDHASLERDGLTGTLTLVAPSQGLGELRYDNQRLVGRWACATIADARRGTTIAPQETFAIEEAYVRGDDLIVVYQPSSELPYRWQVYWRSVAAESPRLATIDLILSVQTPHLDTRPVFVVGSQTSASSAKFIDPEGRQPAATPNGLDRQAGASGLAALLPLNTQQTLVEMVHPEDYDGCRTGESSGGGTQTEWRLGETFMEKGVIRRIGVRIALLPSDVAEAETPSLLQQWLNQTPPLTA